MREIVKDIEGNGLEDIVDEIFPMSKEFTFNLTTILDEDDMM